ncbi:hypothetical protein AZE42_06858 [Rhizopogon vesiculosus]|uniref:DUF6533 domain-containing protein n=1 Tax=Rhizopogon vesiculosus TaxID=180088 RepID=A0A1J8Q7U6_9AGAM|nr:hypothetical protein AZE42_06858 [Rhizopogon vesiculosus]
MAVKHIGAMAVAIYDYCVTIALEVQLIWGRRWNVLRITFTLARYVTFIGAAMTTYGLLIFRTFAFWHQSKKVLVWLFILAAICIAGSIGVTKAVNSLNSSAPGANTTDCVFESGKTSAIQYAFLILFELVLMVLTIYKRFDFYKGSRGRLVTTLYRDGLVYMTCIIMASVANIFVDLFAPASYTDIMDASVNSIHLAGFLSLIVLRPQLVIHGVLASRILFNLRQSRESESKIVDGIFPLAYTHRRLPSGATTVHDSTFGNPHEHDGVKGPHS